MKWITLEEIKQQCRIDSSFTAEDAILQKYGEAAENGILRLINRSWEDVLENLSNDDITGGLKIAALMLTDHLYQHHGPTSNVQVYQIPYTIDFFVKSFERLADNNQNANENDNRYGCPSL